MRKMTAIAAFERLSSLLCRLSRSRSGVGYVEFAYAFPIVMGVGMAGIEAANLAMSHMRISQIALSMADNTSRIGQDGNLAQTQFREVDITDSFVAAARQAGNRDIIGKGRIILSSLEKNPSEGNWIHWQRCTGNLKIAGAIPQPQYGSWDVNGKTKTDFPGMGTAGHLIVAPAGNAVMFVEIFYEYEPLISKAFFGKPIIHYSGAFIVRDKRDLAGDASKTGKLGNVYNPAPAVTSVPICP